jgi:hypothetical protein
MRLGWLTVLCLITTPLPCSAGVIVLGNYSEKEITFSINEPDKPPRKHILLPHQVLPYQLTAPATLALTSSGTLETYHVEPYHAYVVIPTNAGRLGLQQLELPGQPPERDLRAELNPRPRKPVVIPVVVLVDDADPRAETIWQAETRQRIEAASVILEAQSGFQLKLVGYEIWKSDPNSQNFQEQFDRFEGSVRVKDRAIAIGFTSRKVDVKNGFGVTRGLGASHVLVREWQPRSEPERVEVLLHYLAMTLGAVPSPDPGSVMRDKLGDGQAVRPGYVIRLDPLNALALNLWADIRRSGFTELARIPQVERSRLIRVYGALARAYPHDLRAMDYLKKLEQAHIHLDEPMVNLDQVPQPVDETKRNVIARSVLEAIIKRLETHFANTRLTGDALTADLLRVALETALKHDGAEVLSGLLLGIGIALDDTNRLREDPLISTTIRQIESDVLRSQRLKCLTNPTIRNRRDLRQRFAVGCVTGQLLSEAVAEQNAISELMFDLHRPAGLSFACLAAEFGGIRLGKKLQLQPQLLKQLGLNLTPATLIPDTAGLSDGIGVVKFEREYGYVDDLRFLTVVNMIRERACK